MLARTIISCVNSAVPFWNWGILKVDLRGGELMTTLSAMVIKECKQKLLEAKEDILNRAQEARNRIATDDNKGGDEGDQTVRALEESEFLRMNERLRKQIVEIEMALSRIESGNYGICEETDEFIEVDRLIAIPWTRLSIEGAEMRESMNKRYAR